MAEIRVESFPFDSDFDGYDDKGYPVYDRAVDARTYRSSLEQFFSDGVFGTPANALQIGKGSGLSVTIQPGIGIIRGAIGGVFEDPVTLELDAEPPQGNIAYSIMLRCDDNDDRRSMFLTVVKGTADTDPTPPAPTDNALIKDIRLGYVVVPSGATDLANATVTNEKGLSVCPYAAPFEEIDVDGIVSDFRVSANEALTKLLQYFQSYEGVVDSALSDTEAGYLQSQITAIQEQLANTDLSGSVDNETIEYATAPGEAASKLRVKDGGIGYEQIGPAAIDNATIGNDEGLHVLAEGTVSLLHLEEWYYPREDRVGTAVTSAVSYSVDYDAGTWPKKSEGPVMSVSYTSYDGGCYGVEIENATGKITFGLSGTYTVKAHVKAVTSGITFTKGDSGLDNLEDAGLYVSLGSARTRVLGVTTKASDGIKGGTYEIDVVVANSSNKTAGSTLNAPVKLVWDNDLNADAWGYPHGTVSVETTLTVTREFENDDISTAEIQAQLDALAGA